MTESTNIEKSIDQETSSITNPIQFISLISRIDKPLYIQAFNIDDDVENNDDDDDDDDDDNNKQKQLNNKISTTNVNANKFLKFNFLSHMALDIFSSPSSLSLREQQQQSNNKGELNTILLFIQDQIMVYGYETNNGLKIVIGFDQNYQINSKNLDNLFLNIHKCYLRTIFNPLNGILNNSSISSSSSNNNNIFDHVDEGEILLQSSTFNKNIKNLVNSFT